MTFTREGRSLIYAADYPTMNGLLGYLTENCCQGNAGELRCGGRSHNSKAKGMA